MTRVSGRHSVLGRGELDDISDTGILESPGNQAGMPTVLPSLSNNTASFTSNLNGVTTDSKIATLALAPVNDLPLTSTVVPAASPTVVAAASASHLTYLLKVDGVTGDSRMAGYEGWFTVDEYTFGELSRLGSLGAGGGASAGRPQLDPLMVDLSGLPEGLVSLLRDAVTGHSIRNIELAGVKTVGDGPAVKFYDLTLRNVTVAGYAEDGGHDTAVAFDYRSGTETIFAPNREGTDVGQSFSFNLARNGGTITPVSQDTLAAFAHSHAGVALTYLLKVDGVTGDSRMAGYEGWFTVDEYTFGELSRLAIPSATSSLPE